MADRSVQDNIRLRCDLISYLNRESVPELLLCLEFEKAIDTVDWHFMFSVIGDFGFCPEMDRYILQGNEINCHSQWTIITAFFCSDGLQTGGSTIIIIV